MIKLYEDKIKFIKRVQEAIYDDSYSGLSYDVVENLCRDFVTLFMAPYVNQFIGSKHPHITFSYAPPTERELEGQEAVFYPSKNLIVMAIRAVDRKTRISTGRNSGSYFNAHLIFRAFESIAHEYEHFIQNMLVKMVKQGKEIPEEFKNWFALDTQIVANDFLMKNNTEKEEAKQVQLFMELYPDIKEYVQALPVNGEMDKILSIVDAKYYCRADEVDARFSAIKVIGYFEESVHQVLGKDNSISLQLSEYKRHIMSNERHKLGVYEPVYQGYLKIIEKLKNAGIFGE